MFLVSGIYPNEKLFNFRHCEPGGLRTAEWGVRDQDWVLHDKWLDSEQTTAERPGPAQLISRRGTLTPAPVTSQWWTAPPPRPDADRWNKTRLSLTSLQQVSHEGIQGGCVRLRRSRQVGPHRTVRIRTLHGEVWSNHRGFLQKGEQPCTCTQILCA